MRYQSSNKEESSTVLHKDSFSTVRIVRSERPNDAAEKLRQKNEEDGKLARQMLLAINQHQTLKPKSTQPAETP